MNQNHRQAQLSRHGKRMGRPPVVPEEHRLLFQQLRVACREACDLMLTMAEEDEAFVQAYDGERAEDEATYGDLHYGLKQLAEMARVRERR